MKSLTKYPNSGILAAGLTYGSGDNSGLRQMLLDEQRGFCAYTEKRVSDLDSCDIEHFDRTKKGNDGYFNYYATLHSANKRKRGKESKHEGAPFFASLFFQDRASREERIQFVSEDNTYEEVHEEDSEAKDLIDYLGFNDPILSKTRRRHLNRLQGIFEDTGWTESEQIEYLDAHPEETSFPTAIEASLGLTLSPLLSPSG